jgi:hypothetical protein
MKILSESDDESTHSEEKDEPVVKKRIKPLKTAT